ncbi:MULTISPECIES: alcohol dehydrogenase family protein [Paracoccus]|uniref:alcohol dehydrogenase family protein n=1 Tax=Paracoccus TaxID=265 RepID=UPI001E41BEFD|nr:MULTISPECIES: alcohol dehydrogenase family protein [Paracoccus]MDK8874271.1 alcohol dehydrogenase family protein [Paracoccus sp. SSJ]UFS63877.1 alcohol dehydrogenase family protein [Paracoccus denitrificans]
MTAIPETMCAMVLTGHGGTERLEWREDWPVPRPGPGEVLVRITACAKNNTDRKVREGLYSTADDGAVTSFAMAGNTLSFPRIQGADVVGHVVAVGQGVPTDRIGERGLLDFNIYPDARDDLNLAPDYFGHGADGGFAEYGCFPSEQFHAIANPALGDAELATLGMCSWQTGYRMLTSAGVGAGEHVLVTGASGGVGTALLQLCRVIGAIPHAVASAGKAEALHALGAETVIDRNAVGDWPSAIDRATGGATIDAVMDLVGGEMTVPLIQAMCRDMRRRTTPPRLSIAGASAGNVTALPWTLIYLNQVRIFGVSHGTRAEARQLIGWIGENRLKPVLAGIMPLSRLREAERLFVERGRDFIGKLVIVPDRVVAEQGLETMA